MPVRTRQQDDRENTGTCTCILSVQPLNIKAGIEAQHDWTADSAAASETGEDRAMPHTKLSDAETPGSLSGPAGGGPTADGAAKGLDTEGGKVSRESVGERVACFGASAAISLASFPAELKQVLSGSLLAEAPSALDHIEPLNGMAMSTCESDSQPASSEMACYTGCDPTQLQTAPKKAVRRPLGMRHPRSQPVGSAAPEMSRLDAGSRAEHQVMQPSVRVAGLRPDVVAASGPAVEAAPPPQPSGGPLESVPIRRRNRKAGARQRAHRPSSDAAGADNCAEQCLTATSRSLDTEEPDMSHTAGDGHEGRPFGSAAGPAAETAAKPEDCAADAGPSGASGGGQPAAEDAEANGFKSVRRRKRKRVRFSVGPLRDVYHTRDGHPDHEGLTATQRREVPSRWPEDLTPSNIRMLEIELGESCRASLDRLKRRVGLLPPIKRPRIYANATRAGGPKPVAFETPAAARKAAPAAAAAEPAAASRSAGPPAKQSASLSEVLGLSGALLQTGGSRRISRAMQAALVVESVMMEPPVALPLPALPIQAPPFRRDRSRRCGSLYDTISKGRPAGSFPAGSRSQVACEPAAKCAVPLFKPAAVRGGNSGL